jgi:hypothetical protein
MTLLWRPTGPLMKYADGMLHIEDLNPAMKTRWRMSRWELFCLGWQCLRASV